MLKVLYDYGVVSLVVRIVRSQIASVGHGSKVPSQPDRSVQAHTS